MLIHVLVSHLLLLVILYTHSHTHTHTLTVKPTGMRMLTTSTATTMASRNSMLVPSTLPSASRCHPMIPCWVQSATGQLSVSPPLWTYFLSKRVWLTVWGSTKDTLASSSVSLCGTYSSIPQTTPTHSLLSGM